jgi:hypothetical protein
LLMKEHREAKGKPCIVAKPSNDLAAHFIPSLLEAESCPVIVQSSQLAWFSAYPTSTFLLDTHHVKSGEMKECKEVLRKAKSYRHPNAPILFDYSLEKDEDSIRIQLLTSNYKKNCLDDLKRMGESISPENVRLVIAAIVSLVEDFGISILAGIDLTKIWFEEDTPVIQGISYASILDSGCHAKKYVWQTEAPFSRLALLLAEMISGSLSQFSSFSSCISKLSKIHSDVGDFLTLLMAEDIGVKDVKANPFLKNEQLGPRLLTDGLGISDSNTSPIDLSYVNTPRDLSGGSRYHTDFEEIEFLGKGGFGSVLKVKNLIDGRFYAVKKIRLNPLDKESSKRLIREVQTLSRLQSEFIVRYEIFLIMTKVLSGLV